MLTVFELFEIILINVNALVVICYSSGEVIVKGLKDLRLDRIYIQTSLIVCAERMNVSRINFFMFPSKGVML